MKLTQHMTRAMLCASTMNQRSNLTGRAISWSILLVRASFSLRCVRLVLRNVAGASLLVLLIAAGALGQMPNDGGTSKGNQPGAPAGSYTLTNFEHVNLYNGNVNFSLPLLQIGGRGGAKSTINLTVDGMQWHLDSDMASRDGANVAWGAQYQNYTLSPATTVTTNCHIEDVIEGMFPIYNFVCDEFQMSEETQIDLSIISE